MDHRVVLDPLARIALLKFVAQQISLLRHTAKERLWSIQKLVGQITLGIHGGVATRSLLLADTVTSARSCGDQETSPLMGR